MVESCVNYVGVDVNTASPALLRYVSGLNQLTARRMYEFRCQHGPFRNREQFREVPGFGEATFVQAAGFLKISGGENPLDATWIHPESYAVASRVMERLDAAPAALTEKDAAAAVLAQKIAAVDLDAMAKELEVGTLTLKDILAQLVRPGRDPREDLPAPVFKQGVLKLEDLSPGMELTGTVLNVVDFGCFVDIGMHDSGLVHVSHLADRYHPRPARGRRRGRHRQGVGAVGGQGAAAGVADDGCPGQPAAAASTRRSAGDRRRAGGATAKAGGERDAAVAGGPRDNVPPGSKAEQGQQGPAAATAVHHGASGRRRGRVSVAVARLASAGATAGQAAAPGRGRNPWCRSPRP